MRETPSGHRPERDRHLPEDVTWLTFAQDPLDPVDELTGSMRPSSTAKSARSAPSCAAYSPATRLTSAAAREICSRWARSRSAKSATAPISSGVTKLGHLVPGWAGMPFGWGASPAPKSVLIAVDGCMSVAATATRSPCRTPRGERYPVGVWPPPQAARPALCDVRSFTLPGCASAPARL